MEGKKEKKKKGHSPPESDPCKLDPAWNTTPGRLSLRDNYSKKGM